MRGGVEHQRERDGEVRYQTEVTARHLFEWRTDGDGAWGRAEGRGVLAERGKEVFATARMVENFLFGVGKADGGIVGSGRAFGGRVW